MTHQLATLELHGNHDPCPACELRREMQDTTPILRDQVPCNVCKGTGMLPIDKALRALAGEDHK